MTISFTEMGSYCSSITDNLKVSVIIATFRRSASLSRAVASLCAQRRVPDEIVISVWTGDEESCTAINRLAPCAVSTGCLIKLTVVVVPSNTVTAKENAGIRAASGDVLCFMDDDAAARPDWLGGLLAHYADPSVGGVGGRDVVRANGQVLERHVRQVGRLYWFGRLTGNHHNRSIGVRDVNFLKGCNMSFRREALALIDQRLVGTIPYGFEIDMGLTARDRGFRLVYDPDAQVDHYPSTDYGAHNAALSRVVNHNQTYILLKRLPWPRKMAFLLYTFLVGDRNTIGLLRVPVAVWRERWPADAVRAHFDGKLGGIRAYVASLRNSRGS